MQAIRVFGQRVSGWLATAAVLALAFSGGSAMAAKGSPDNVWSEISESTISRTSQPRFIVPERYQTVRLSRVAFDSVMAGVPMEIKVPLEQSSSTLSLPMPDGSFGEFRIVESPIMAPQLAAKYPQIRTWVAQGIDDPSATARLDVTPKGFHAQVISWQGTSYVDPYQPGDQLNYIVYRKNDYHSGKQIQCEVEGRPISPKEVADPSKRGVNTQLMSGANLRTYLLAMAATGEYTQFHGGTVLEGLSVIVSTVNRVTGIYEREVSVRFQLVPDEDKIIYTNADSDPYTNTSGDLSANQSNINLEIGSANYDVGHLVGTGGGGVAALGVICSGNKAFGLTGSGVPIGDSFDVDFVAHEMGHQFGGNHTFNGSGGNCSGGNRNGSTAYEPGSGITIQAYAGICGGDNTQPNSEDYFHRVSLNEIITHTTSGSGGTCGVLTATGNTPPTVSTSNATIPRSTPFELMAIGNDVDGDTMTYLWEQFDKNAANETGTLIDDGGPLFRSYLPGLESSRVFPSLRYILNNANVAPATAPLPGTASPNFFTAELLPSVSRTRNFRVTVRDNRASGGGTNEANAAITIVESAGPFQVTAPNTAVSWAAGSSQTVDWDVANTDVAPTNTANVRIRLSLDGGYTWPVDLVASEVNDGSAFVTIPPGTPASTQARLRVEAVDNIYFDVSDSNFTITGSNTAPTIIVSGSVSTRQGSPAAAGVVATVADAQDAAGSLAVNVAGAPPELNVSVANSGGSVTLTAAAECTLVAPTGGNRIYPLLLGVTDSEGATRSAQVNVNVGSNQQPTLGNYSDLLVVRSTITTNAPGAAPADPNNNFSTMDVSPTTLPGGGTVSIVPDGTVTITTDAATTFGSYPIRAMALDSCGATVINEFNVVVASSEAAVQYESSEVLTGNGIIEPNECNQINVTLRNAGANPATGVSAIVSTATPNVTITQPNTTFADIPAGQTRTSQVPIQVSSTAGLVCLTDVDLDVSVTYAGGPSPYAGSFALPVGLEADDNYQFIASTDTIPAGGSLVELSSGDDLMVNLPVPAGFDFSVYGTAVTGGSNLRASTNGTLQLIPSGGSTAYDNQMLPSAANGFPAADPVLMPYWDDLRTDTVGGGIFTSLGGTAPNRYWVVEWRGQSYVPSPTVVNTVFAIVLYEGNNDFDYIYGQLDGTPSNAGGATIGVQAATSGTVFTQYSLNSDSVAAGDKLSASLPPAICNIGSGGCSPGVDADLAVSSTLLSGTVVVGSQVSFQVTVNNLSGIVDVPAADFEFSIAPPLDNPQWTCVADANASCSAGGSGLPSESISIAAGTGVMYVITGDIPSAASPGDSYVATASIVPTAPNTDANSSNNSSDATATVAAEAVFSDGFE